MRTLDVDVRAHLVSLAAVFLDVTQRSVRDIQKTAARETRTHQIPFQKILASARDRA